MANQHVADLDLLRHALGCEPERPRKSWGFRNYYVGAEPGLDRMVALGLAKCHGSRGELSGGDVCYSATRDGCLAVGMTEREIKRMEPPPS